MSETPVIRPARADEAAALSALALRSKGHWGYDAEFLARCRDPLTVSAKQIQEHEAMVLEDDGGLLGFFVLAPLPASGAAPAPGAPDGTESQDWDLDFFFLDPSAIGQGLGQVLWDAMLRVARQAGARRLVIHSDPGAEGFYLRMGALRDGDVASTADSARRLPRLYCLTS